MFYLQIMDEVYALSRYRRFNPPVIKTPDELKLEHFNYMRSQCYSMMFYLEKCSLTPDMENYETKLLECKQLNNTINKYCTKLTYKDVTKTEDEFRFL